MNARYALRFYEVLERVLALGAALVLSFGVAVLASRFQPGRWYDALQKPALTPPAWVFGPVWSVLYLTIAVSAWFVWQVRVSNRVGAALFLWAAQLALNGTWSWLFFGLRRPGLAFLDIAVLWVTILGTVIAFLRIRMAAGLLLIPYLLWVGFAAWLNWSLWRLNP